MDDLIGKPPNSARTSAGARKARPFVYAHALVHTAKDAATGDDVERAIHFLKGYTVFNLEQIEGLPAHFHVPAETPRLDPPPRIERADRFFRRHGRRTEPRRQPRLLPAFDRQHRASIRAFRDAESYYSTLAHETKIEADKPLKIEAEQPLRVQVDRYTATERPGE